MGARQQYWHTIASSRLSFFATLGLALLGTVALWAIWAAWGVNWFANHLSGRPDIRALEQLGQVGDIFGGANALFAALAFVGVAFAAYFQHETYRIAERQLTQQSFEPLFFHLLSLHREISDKARGLQDPQYVKVAGPQGFNHKVKEIRDNLARGAWPDLIKAPDRAQRVRILESYYLPLYVENEDTLGPYFRSLYHIFKLIKHSTLPRRDKIRYANIARSTLGKEQIFLLAINGVTKYGEGFVGLIEEYGLLKHASRNDAQPTVDQWIVEWMYSPTAALSEDERAKYWVDHPDERPIDP